MQDSLKVKESGKLSVTTGYQYEYLNRPITGSTGGPNIDEESTQSQNFFVTIGYGLSEAWTVSLAIPHRSIYAPKTPGGVQSKHIERHYAGLGDMILMSSYRPRPASPWDFSFGLRMPTGHADPDYDWIASDGSVVHSRDPVLQPGFGTWDPILGARYSISAGSYPAFASALYRFSGGWNRYDYKYGDELQLSAGVAFPWRDSSHALTVGASALFAGYDYDRVKGGRVNNTGGEWVNLFMGMDYTLDRDTDFALLVQVPVYRNTNGNILNSDYLITGSIRYAFGAGGSASGSTRVLQGGDRLEVEKHLAHGKRTVVEFYSRECATSRMVYDPLRALIRRHPGIAWLRVDVTDADDAVMRRYGLEATPDIRGYSADGVETGKFGADLEALQEWLSGR